MSLNAVNEEDNLSEDAVDHASEQVKVWVLADWDTYK